MQVVRMVLPYRPLKALMPPAIVFGTIGLAKLGYELVDKDFRIGTITIGILGAAVSLATLAMIADLSWFT